MPNVNPFSTQHLLPHTQFSPFSSKITLLNSFNFHSQKNLPFSTMASGGCSRGPVKVVIINTQYVETDATSFKSVVQKLTGKDSDTSEPQAERKRHDKGGTERSFFMRDLSFKDFDRLLREMPPLNDLWAD
uniref:VQ domain-containing protein n=2 Tax=Phaseolus vulgaris TaxID=3885 RepID=V7BXC0_PHAVU|nr:hypothetical protein PHAVU_005G051400g [Phaseolus vulgaris]ESW21211.1 hypothetical protein PHAVU_005G051400g [Phaseolus vulgaris]